MSFINYFSNMWKNIVKQQVLKFPISIRCQFQDLEVLESVIVDGWISNKARFRLNDIAHQVGQQISAPQIMSSHQAMMINRWIFLSYRLIRISDGPGSDRAECDIERYLKSKIIRTSSRRKYSFCVFKELLFLAVRFRSMMK